jgi:thiol:disulfide interchange protein DsbD
MNSITSAHCRYSTRFRLFSAQSLWLLASGSNRVGSGVAWAPSLLLLLLLAVVPFSAARALGPGKVLDLSAQCDPAPVAPGGKAVLRVRAQVGPEFHLYEESTNLSLEFPKGGAVLSRDVQKPRGVMKIDSVTGEKTLLYEGRLEFLAAVDVEAGAAPGTLPVRILIDYQACTDATCFFPTQDTLLYAISVDPLGASVPSKALPPATASVDPVESTNGVQGSGATTGGEEDGAFARVLGRSLPTALGLLWVFGLIASFTPCVLPMIPITVRIITTTSGGDRKRGVLLSIVYVLGIAATYVTLGVSAGMFGGLFGAYLGNPWVIWTLILVFAALGMSSFGFYKIALPSGLQMKLNTAGGGASTIGVFVMGLAGGLIAAPCVGPVLAGLILWIGQEGSPALGALYMSAFSLGFGTLFLILGAGGNAVMPKAGAWMIGVERVLGTMLFAGALYFLNQVVEPTTFSIVLGTFLVVLGRWMAASPGESESSFLLLRSGLGVLVTAAGLLAVLGTIAINGWLLPRPLLFGGGAVESGAPAHVGIPWQAADEARVDLALAAGRPVLIDFTADWCIACRELDKITFSDAAVATEAQRFTALQVDCTKSKEPAIRAIQARFGINSLPTVLMIGGDGEIVSGATVRGFLEPESFLSRMRAVH